MGALILLLQMLGHVLNFLHLSNPVKFHVHKVGPRFDSLLIV